METLIQNANSSSTISEPSHNTPSAFTLRHARFCIQAAISGSVIIFCMFEVLNGEKSPVYYSLISGIVGFWLPAPSVSHSH